MCRSGRFCPGGVDSSTVTALMQSQSDRPVRTFTIGNRNPSYDEAIRLWQWKHLGTEHTELYVSPEQVCRSSRACLQSMMSLRRPFADPHYLLCS